MFQPMQRLELHPWASAQQTPWETLNTLPISYDIIPPVAAANPGNPSGSVPTSSSPISSIKGSSKGSSSGSSGSGGSSGGSSHGRSSGSNSGGENGLPQPNIPPNDSSDYTFYDFLGELVICFYEIYRLLAIIFTFIVSTAIIWGIVFPQILIAIVLALIVCLVILVVWWAIQKIFEGLFKPKKPGG